MLQLQVIIDVFVVMDVDIVDVYWKKNETIIIYNIDEHEQ